ncbi:hypothetical protein F5Y04DRAFT_290814 [Hypomontagnella monticulosa]|nr:hypothetical protein F5Y04DRAFT_290814 [Hypomontagnella monticulosa]
MDKAVGCQSAAMIGEGGRLSVPEDEIAEHPALSLEIFQANIERHATMMKDMNATIAELGKRIEVLEQKLLDSAKSAHKHDIRVDAVRDVPNKDAESDGKQGESKTEEGTSTELSFLRNYVEFRKQAFSEGKVPLKWVPDIEMDIGEKPTTRRPFRYDSYEDGRLAFAVHRSAALYDTLVKLCQPTYSGQVTASDDYQEIANSAFPLLRCRDDLKKMENSASDERITMELKAMHHLYEREGHLRSAQRRYDDLLQNKKIDFASLKGLFPINQLVVFRELRDEWVIARVKTTTAGDELDTFRLHSLRSNLRLECEAIDFDGKSFRNHMYQKLIKQFSGTRNITELPVYPLSFHHDKESLVEESIRSGARWRDLHRKLATPEGRPVAQVMQYVGYCEVFRKHDDDDDDDDDGDTISGIGREIAGRVIVDPIRFPHRRLTFAEHNTDPFDSEPFGSKAEDNPLVLCPEKVLVHSLNDNEWYYVAMRKLYFPTWTPDAWSRLVKPDSSPVADSIERIRSLTKAHAASNRQRVGETTLDNFRGKGKGLTFLLHGPPGVGKTMLAECLSEEHKRPLYRVNLGMFVDNDNWEAKIEEIFRKAHFWDAILLIDEAEVVMSERTQERMHSLAWVAVFLRKIEYFEGVLFLTTNQVHMIDPAFISRVNLGMAFPELNSETRLHIWKKILEPLNGAHWLIDDTSTMAKWASKPLNGRQIRNVVYSAELLADPPLGGRITQEGIEECLQDVKKFIDMIKDEKKTVEMNYMSHWS